MSNFKDFIGGGFDPRNFTEVILTSSQTWVAPQAGDYYVIIQGGGGSGAVHASNASFGSTQGGAGGEIAYGKVTLTLSENVVVTIGAGGAGVSIASNANGNDGGTTSFGGYLSASGGTKGHACLVNPHTPAQIGVRGSFPRGGRLTGSVDNYGALNHEQSENIIHNFFGLLDVCNYGGSNTTGNQDSTVGSNANCAGGGGAGLGGNGGHGFSNGSNPYPVSYGAGSGAVTAVGASGTWSSQNGGGGIVYIYYEAV